MRCELEALRKRMRAAGVDLYIIPTTDYHGSEYVNDIVKISLHIFSRISLTMPLPPKFHNTAYVLLWEEDLHWQSRSSGCSSS